MRISSLLLAALLVPAGAAPRQQEEPQLTRAAYSVAITAAQDVLRSGSPVTVTTAMTNVSDQKIWVVSLGEDVQYDVCDGRGVQLPRSKPRIRHDKDGRRAAELYVVTRHGVWFPVQPGQTVEDESVVSHFYDLTRPGTYTIQAVRADPESHTAVRSNTITVTVVP